LISTLGEKGKPQFIHLDTNIPGGKEKHKVSHHKMRKNPNNGVHFLRKKKN